MAKKYEFTGETKTVFGRTVRRIQAVRDFWYVGKGELGGWIEKEDNLSHEGLCWVFDEAVVMEDAVVDENARISGDSLIREYAEVSGNAQIGGQAVVKGYAQVTENATVQGNALVAGEAIVDGSARVSENAVVKGGGWVSGDSIVKRDALIRSLRDSFTVSHVGGNPWFGVLTAYRTRGGGIEIRQGYFGGTLDEFTEDVNDKHGNSNIGEEYRILIEFLRVRFSA